MQSPNLVDTNIVKIAEMFPNCITEAKDENGILRRVVDFDLLRQELSANLVEGPRERYTLSWPGKNEAILTANAPIAKTLRSCEEESVDFENTKNLYIEGDNLDVLKLLQETYLNKVKMFYLDPPYNTGKDFIYEDDFAEDTESFFMRSNQKDEEGNRLVANTDANGRFHSDWLTMIYPRLKLARNLLREDGVIFISIDDNEVHNLRKVCDEVFGEKNFVATISVQSNPRGRQSDTYIASVHDYLMVYVKSIDIAILSGMPLTKEQKADFKYTDDNGEPYRLLGLRQRGAASKRADRPDMYFPIYVNRVSEEISLVDGNNCESVYPRKSDGSDGRWMWGKEKCAKDKNLLVARLIERRNEYDVFVKDYLNRGDSERTRKYKSIWDAKEYNNQAGTQEVKSLLECDAMSFPKPKNLLIDICRMGLGSNDVVLDFFSGSATTAHATMQLNAEDGGHRKFIMVQLPEPCDEKSEAFKAGYKTIAEIGKERIRRAGKKIKDEWEAKHRQAVLGESAPATAPDIGFRVFKVDTSNMKDVYYTPDELKQDNLELFKDHIKPDRRPEDLLFQVFLDWGLDLTLPIAKETIDGKKVFVVDTNILIACFDSGITEELVKKLAKYKPLRVVFRDDAFGSDSVKINVEQIFKLLSPATEVKSI